MTKENETMVQQMMKEFDISFDDVIDNVLTSYRAMRNAERLEKQDTALVEFIKEDGELLKGQRLYMYLLTLYRANAVPNPVRSIMQDEPDPGEEIKELRAKWKAKGKPDPEAHWL